MKHLAFKVGDMFQIRYKGKNGQADTIRMCRKASHIGFIWVDDPIVGETQFSPEIDALVETIPALIPTSAAPASVPKKAAIKKAKKK